MSVTGARERADAPAPFGLDARTKVLLVLAASVAVMGQGGELFIPAALALGLALAALERAWRRIVFLLAASLAAAAVGWILPLGDVGPFAAAASLTARFALRFIVIGGIAAHLVATCSPTDLAAGLRAMRVPRAVVIPFAVMLRFVPVVAAEARAVIEAMRLRGPGRAGAALAHPLRTAEHFVVPLTAVSLRIGDDLTASALARGLGSQARPTSVRAPRFTTVDLAAAGFAAALGALTLVWAAA